MGRDGARPRDDPDAWSFARARTRRIIDGDTLDLTVDLGFNTHRRVRVRLAGVDTAEIHTVPTESEAYRRGQRHAQFVADWLAAGARDAPERYDEWPLRIWTLPTSGKYGRWIASVERHSDGEDLADALRAEYKRVADD